MGCMERWKGQRSGHTEPMALAERKGNS
jgi:hypothetical protein